MANSPRKFSRATSQKLADFVPATLGDAFVRHGFAQGDLLLHWDEVVGPGLAAKCRPIKLQWPAARSKVEAKGSEAKGGIKAKAESERQPATLLLQVDSAAAIEVQHQQAVLLNRINGFFGWRCVGKISLRQAPLAAKSPIRAARPGMAEMSKAQDMTSAIDDDGLRAALIRLGAQVLTRRQG